MLADLGQPIRGTLLDLSAGGACVIAQWPVEPRSVLARRFHAPSMPVLPLLHDAYVTWRVR